VQYKKNIKLIYTLKVKVINVQQNKTPNKFALFRVLPIN